MRPRKSKYIVKWEKRGRMAKNDSKSRLIIRGFSFNLKTYITIINKYKIGVCPIYYRHDKLHYNIIKKHGTNLKYLQLNSVDKINRYK